MTGRFLRRAAVAFGLASAPAPAKRSLGRDRGLVHDAPYPRRTRVTEAARENRGAVQGATVPAIACGVDAMLGGPEC